MNFVTKTIKIQTSKRREVLNITSQVEELLHQSQVSEGMTLIFTHHTTTSIAINEDEEGLKLDYLKIIGALFDQPGYHHNSIDKNAASHLAATFVGSSITLPVQKERLALGRWQSILFLELDGPRRRSITCHFIGV